MRKVTARKSFSLGIGSVALLLGGLFWATTRAADIENGRILFEEHCAVCHTVIERVRDKSGPNLYSVVGRTAGTDEYLHGYSDELIESGVIWQVPSIQAFINSPALMVRGTKMVFLGLPDFETRLDISCYLERVSSEDAAAPNELCVE